MAGRRAAAAAALPQSALGVPFPATAARLPAAGPTTFFQTAGPACILVLSILTVLPGPAFAQVDRFPEGKIAKIEFEGNNTIRPEQIMPKLLSKVGQPFNHDKVETDLKSLLKTKLFSDVRYYIEESPPKSGKYVLIFAVTEMTLLTKVEFRGARPSA